MASRTLLKWLFTRNIILYLLLAGARFGLVSQQDIATTTMDFLKDIPVSVTAYAQGSKEFDAAQFRSALRYYKYFAKLYPKSAEALNAIGYCYYALGDYQRAVEFFKRAIAGDPEFFGFHMNLGISYYKLGLFEQAVSSIKHTTDFQMPQIKSIANAETPIKKELIAQIPDPQERLPVAIKKTSEYAYLYLMGSLVRMRDYRSTITLLPSALKVGEDYLVWFYYLAGVSAYELGKYQNAYELFDKSLELKPDLCQAAQYLQESAEKLGMGKIPQNIKIHEGQAIQKRLQSGEKDFQLPDWLFFYPPMRDIGEDGKGGKKQFKQ